jgi:voltage-gated potassium channel
MRRNVERMSDHVILCGFGRFGRAVFEELRHKAVPTVVVDVDPTLEAELHDADVPYLIGSALSDDVLEHVGIARARAIVVATPSDSDNVFITLSARERNPRIRIHARGETEVGLRRLRQAGADQVISAYQMGGIRMASAIVRPAVVDFIELSLPGRGGEIDLEEIRVAPESPVAGLTIAEAEQRSPRLRIMALRRGDEPLRVLPDGTVLITPGDLLVVVGQRESVEKL